MSKAADRDGEPEGYTIHPTNISFAIEVVPVAPLDGVVLVPVALQDWSSGAASTPDSSVIIKEQRELLAMVTTTVPLPPVRLGRYHNTLLVEGITVSDVPFHVTELIPTLEDTPTTRVLPLVSDMLAEVCVVEEEVDP